MLLSRGRAERLAGALRDEGIWRTSCLVGRRMRDRWGPLLWMHELHVWSTADLRAERPHLPLADGLKAIRATAAHLDLLEDLGAVGADQALDRLSRGAELWMVLEGERPVYAGWLFHAQAPTVAARSGWIDLPPRVANPEDMITAPDYRGRGLASAMYTVIFDTLQREDRADTVVGKVPVDNIANRRALAKSGWQEFAVVDYRRIGPWRRTRVRPVTTAWTSWLSGQLETA